MTKAYFTQLASYNTWANEIISGWLTSLTQEQWQQPLVSSFESIELTTLHIVGAERVWLDRLNKVEQPVWLPNSYTGNKAEMLQLWKETSAQLYEFISNVDSDQLLSTLQFKRLNGEVNTMEVSEVLAHVLNHSTYHRGQLVTLLRQVGFTDVGSTDLLKYYTSR